MKQDEMLVQRQVCQATGNSLLPANTVAAFREKLAAYIHELINNNFDKLVSMLYLLDVNEQKLKNLISRRSAQDAGFTIADAIMERQLEKIESRKRYSGNSSNIPDDEKW